MKYNVFKALQRKTFAEGGFHLDTERKKISDSRELEFAVFCIENIAAHLGVDAL